MTRREAFLLARSHDVRVVYRPIPMIPLFMVDSEATRKRMACSHVFEVRSDGERIGGDEYVGITDSTGEVFSFMVGE